MVRRLLAGAAVATLIGSGFVLAPASAACDAPPPDSAAAGTTPNGTNIHNSEGETGVSGGAGYLYVERGADGSTSLKGNSQAAHGNTTVGQAPCVEPGPAS